MSRIYLISGVIFLKSWDISTSLLSVKLGLKSDFLYLCSIIITHSCNTCVVFRHIFNYNHPRLISIVQLLHSQLVHKSIYIFFLHWLMWTWSPYIYCFWQMYEILLLCFQVKQIYVTNIMKRKMSYVKLDMFLDVLKLSDCRVHCVHCTTPIVRSEINIQMKGTTE